MRLKTINYKDERIIFSGRTLEIPGIGARFFNWSGSGFTFKFIGTAASARFVIGSPSEGIPHDEEKAYIGVFVDGEIYETARFALNANNGLYVLAENLPYGEHTVKVVKETEMWYGRAGLSELCTDGDFILPAHNRKKHIEFIGDSITCGYGNICSNGSSEFVTAEENFSNTYAAIAARQLDCDISVVAASGNGFYHDYGCNTVNLIPELYEYTEKVFSEHCGISPEKWNFESDKFDAVVIKLGQNDGQYCSGADLKEEERSEELLLLRRKAFEEKAYDFFMRIIAHRPDTPILFICEENMLLKPECLSAAERTGMVETLVFAPKREYEGVGANGHYSVYTHARVAATLTQRLKEIL